MSGPFFVPSATRLRAQRRGRPKWSADVGTELDPAEHLRAAAVVAPETVVRVAHARPRVSARSRHEQAFIGVLRNGVVRDRPGKAHNPFLLVVGDLVPGDHRIEGRYSLTAVVADGVVQ